MDKKNATINPTPALKAIDALTGNNKENVMPNNSTPAANTVFFQDTEGSWWETCDANTPGAENFGPRGCAVRATPPEWLSHAEMEGEWIVYQAYFRHPCIGCGTELAAKGTFCDRCQIDGTERSIRLSDKVDNFAKCNNDNIFYSEDEWNEFK